MKREIKFRAWDKEEKKMFQSMTALNLDDGVHSCTFISNYGDEITVDMERLELMQFTGLHDRNGREVWEGDIVDRDGLINEIIWNDDWAAFCRRIVFHSRHQSVFSFTCDDSVISRVIGNIWENGNLLEDK